MLEKRKYKRSDLNVVIGIQQIEDKFPTGISSESVEVSVINISRGGIAFKSQREFKKNSFYGTTITMDNHDSFNAVIEIVRVENQGEPETTYGCRFVGISEESRFKIDVFQIVKEHNGEGG